jgi:hypothetical protein
MSERVLLAIGRNDVGDRQVFNTGISTVGRGGHDYLCGHCGHKMMSGFDFSRLEVEIVFQCGTCGGHNLRPEDDEAPQAEGEAPAEGNDNAEG